MLFILLPVILIALYFLSFYLQESLFFIDAIRMFFDRLPDFVSWLPGPVSVLIPVIFAVTFALRVWGRL